MNHSKFKRTYYNTKEYFFQANLLQHKGILLMFITTKTYLKITFLNLLLILFSTSCTTNKIYMTTGIKIGNLSQTSATIWTRISKSPHANQQGIPFKAQDYQVPKPYTLEQMQYSAVGANGKVRVSYWKQNNPQQKTIGKWLNIDPKKDFTKQINITNLIPNTHYIIQIDAKPIRSKQITATIHGKFTTLPTSQSPTNATFTVITGQRFSTKDNENGQKIYPQMLKLNPQFLIHTGDIEYYDKPAPYAKNQTIARYKWNRLYSLPYLKNFHRNIPAYFIKDDHDILKNDCWRGQTYGDLTWQQGLNIFAEQFPTHTPAYQTIRIGKDLQIWLVEGREYRSPNNTPDDPNKTIWGEKQKKWFFRTVKQSDATFRILISPTPIVGPDRKTKNDNHANKGFTYEGEQIRSFIGKQKNMYIICGDRHWQYISVDPKSKAREYSCGPTTDIHAGGFKQKYRSAMHKYLKIKGGFLAVQVQQKNNKPTITLTHYSTNGQIYHQDTFTANP